MIVDFNGFYCDSGFQIKEFSSVDQAGNIQHYFIKDNQPSFSKEDDYIRYIWSTRYTHLLSAEYGDKTTKEVMESIPIYETIYVRSLESKQILHELIPNEIVVCPFFNQTKQDIECGYEMHKENSYCSLKRVFSYKSQISFQ